jgi:hypothetical protein
MLVAMLCQQEARGILITETHPKALLWLERKATCEHTQISVAMSDLNEYFAGDSVKGASDHERDAGLSAIAAYYMVSRSMRWQDLYVFEPCPITPLNPPPGYWMPLLPE